MLAIPAGAAFRPGSPEGRPAGLLREVADGAAALRAHPQAVRLVGADIMCSLVYGMQTVLLILVARQAGPRPARLRLPVRRVGAGGLAGTALASRVLRVRRPHAVLAGGAGRRRGADAGAGRRALGRRWRSCWPPLTGAGAILVEIMTETAPAADAAARGVRPRLRPGAARLDGGIVAGSLIAPLLVGLLGTHRRPARLRRSGRRLRPGCCAHPGREPSELRAAETLPDEGVLAGACRRTGFGIWRRSGRTAAIGACRRCNRVLNVSVPRVAIGPQRRDFAEKAIRDGGGEPADVDAQADALVWLNPGDVDGLRAALQTASSARWVQLPFAGVEKVASAGILDPGRAWTSAKGAYAEPVAEHALMLALAGLRLAAQADHGEVLG